MFDKLSAEQRKVLLFAIGGVVLLLVGFAVLHRKALTAGAPTDANPTGAPNYTRGGDIYVQPGATFAPGATITPGSPTTSTTGTPTSGIPVTPGSPVITQLPVSAPVVTAAVAAPAVAGPRVLALVAHVTDNTAVAPAPDVHPQAAAAIVQAVSIARQAQQTATQDARKAFAPLASPAPKPAGQTIGRAGSIAQQAVTAVRRAFAPLATPTYRPQFNTTAAARASRQERLGY